MQTPEGMERSVCGLRAHTAVTAGSLLSTQIGCGQITETGLRGNISVAIRCLEDAASAEVARAQIWQWLRHGARLAHDGPRITPPLIRLLVAEELEGIRAAVGDEAYASGRFAEVTALFEQVVLGERSATSSPFRPTSVCSEGEGSD